MPAITFSPNKVEANPEEMKGSTWSRPGGEQVKGIKHLYVVTDQNMQSHKTWRFSVQVSDATGEIGITPEDCPKKKAYGDLPHRSVMFLRATEPPFEGYMYCKVFLSDITGEKNRKGVRYSQKGNLPPWFKDFPSRIFQRKQSVHRGKMLASDGNPLVCVVRANNHLRMIRLYFAMRVWILRG